MAVTKTHPIKRALKAAIDYICNPEKADGKLLVSSYGCAAETADIEFAWTRRHAIDKGTNLGRHLIQAFQPGEVTSEQAHEIGMELAKEILGGRYEKERGAGLPLALDPLRVAVWDLASAALNHTGRRDRPVPSELRLCRPYRRLRPCLAAAGGGMVCAADAVPPADGGLCVYHHRGLGPRYGNVENGRFADGKTIHNLMEKGKPFPTGLQTAFPQPRNSGSLRTFPQRILRRNLLLL